MASPFQQASTRRKIVYFALIFALFVANTFFWRGVSSQLTGGKPLPWTVTARADDLQLREVNLGAADLTGNALRLMLTGSRGIATCVLWNQAEEKKKKHEWNRLELIVNSLTKLQPHSLTPWLFQSWNLSYNVSVESDRVKDKFFYIARGIELLGRGERLNDNHPDLRYAMGFYIQNKFGISDEHNTLRCLMQMSSINPLQRKPDLFRPGGKDQPIDPQQFEKFCRTNPQLVRRLADKLGYTSPETIVEFLTDNYSIPNRYYYDPETERAAFGREPGQLRSIDERFPILPQFEPRFLKGEFNEQNALLNDDFCNYACARSWFSAAQDPLPPAGAMIAIQDKAERVRGTRYRMPRQPAEQIFRHAPARSQSYIAERLEKEGWYDETGWVVFDPDAGSVGYRWFGSDSTRVALGTNRNWSVEAWSRAFDLWREHGERTFQYIETTEKVRLDEKAKSWREFSRLNAMEMGPDITQDITDPALIDSYKAHRTLFFSQQNRGMTNFDHHYFRAFIEREPQTVQARKQFFEAKRAYKAADTDRALALYDVAFDMWKKVLLRSTDFRNDSGIQEDIYEQQMEYMTLVQENRGPQMRPALMTAGVLGSVLAGDPTSVAAGTMYGMVTDIRSLPLPLVGPLDQTAPDGKPWLDPSVGDTARSRSSGQ